MHDTLTKPWASHEAGTAVADNPTEAAELGAVEVAPVRFAYLRDHGFFKPAPPPPVPKVAPVASSEAVLASLGEGEIPPPAPGPGPAAATRKGE